MRQSDVFAELKRDMFEDIQNTGSADLRKTTKLLEEINFNPIIGQIQTARKRTVRSYKY